MTAASVKSFWLNIHKILSLLERFMDSIALKKVVVKFGRKQPTYFIFDLLMRVDRDYNWNSLLQEYISYLLAMTSTDERQTYHVDG